MTTPTTRAEMVAWLSHQISLRFPVDYPKGCNCKECLGNAAWVETHAEAILDAMMEAGVVLTTSAARTAIKTDPALRGLIGDAIAAYKAMSPAEREAHDRARLESWVRGQIGMGSDADEAACRAALKRGEPMPEPPARTEPAPPEREPVVDTPDAAFARGRLAGLEEAAKLADRGAASCRERASAAFVQVVADYHSKGALELELLAIAIRALINQPSPPPQTPPSPPRSPGPTPSTA